MMGKIKVLVADDHPVIREGLRAMLATEDSIEVVGEATNGAEAVEKVKELAPDVVLMDIRMPEMDGIVATRRVKEECPQTAVILLTVYDDDAYVVDAVIAGAGGYLLKDASRDLLLHTIRAALDGGTLVKTSLLQEAIVSFLEGAGGRTTISDHGSDHGRRFGLTPREMEVLELVGTGSKNRQIATSLGITEDTTKKYLKSIIAKLRASDRTHAATIAARAGLLGDSVA